MVAVAAEGPIRGADAVPAAEREAARAAGAAEAAVNGGDAEAGKEEMREYESDMRKLEDLLSKLNPSAEEFVPLSRRRGDGGARRLSADAPVFVSPAIDYYARPQVLPPPLQQQPMHVLQLVGGVAGGGMGGAGGMDSSSDGSANGQPNRRRRNGFIQGRRRMMGSRPRRADREDSVRRTVYVSDIDQHVTEQKLAEVFSTCGQVVDCRICGDPNSVLRFAFIEFADDVGARAALTLGGTMLGFYPVKVLPSKTAILPVNPKFLPRTENEKEMVSRTVYCTNIDKKVAEDEVKQFFEGTCGEVSRLRLLGDYVHSTCIAFVEFVQADSAILALNCSGMVLGTLPGESVKDTSAPSFAPCDVVLNPASLACGKPSSRAAANFQATKPLVA
ncbi:Polyadenylate-binding protein-interacting protein 8 [Dichanthelium oligosanthes]|uniref:Polyadenylate-binding protein-interacting protein 8 n=1 Tax=Dichanthelium oligosanthes TaxID=888268 RepID=A0A1E5VYZ2_9POAL|nr:Polyadenylate-binding protein-interacting protein 8 [Dichanthelium oligosanthes]